MTTRLAKQYCTTCPWETPFGGTIVGISHVIHNHMPLTWHGSSPMKAAVVGNFSHYATNPLTPIPPEIQAR